MGTQLQPNLHPNALTNLYEQDFYLWLKKTAELLHDGRFNELDLGNLIEEIECMGRSERKALKSRLITLLEHLLKLSYWEAEKEYNARGWRDTIVEQRTQILLLLEDSPRLKVLLMDSFFACYQIARENTAEISQLPLEVFPAEPPFTLEGILKVKL